MHESIKMGETASRPSSERQAPVGHGAAHLGILDYARGVAIFLVFFIHSARHAFGEQNLDPQLALSRLLHFAFPELLLVIPSLGWVGVPIFFVISGFCIHLSHARSKETGFKRFFIRRFFRIYPPYLVALLFFSLVYPGMDFRPWRNVLYFISHLFLLHNLDMDQIYTINGSFWSIGIEVQLYLLYPLLLLLVRRLGWSNGLYLVLAIEFFFNTIPVILFHLRLDRGWDTTAFCKLPFAYWFSWAIGAKIADDWMLGKEIFLSRFPLWVWPAVFLVVYFQTHLVRYSFTLAALSTAPVLAMVLSHPGEKLLGSFPFAKHLRQVGLVSYSAYLLHEPLIGVGPDWLRSAFPSFSPPPIFIFSLCLFEWPFVILISWGFYRLVELPAIACGKWVQHRLNGKANVALAASA